ncbi:hypothetical protein Dsin_019469 [Dipteronia sinensis]|uniref:Reverse transcriptase zinc-binding domain-containing protein n=1 Tax=Dipteronia sinensis TaxID=43782 RepID=A0AAE0E2V1_9ROSI|nr:hypothetical protein Dsin_019469 [Dipteronia sinensis]
MEESVGASSSNIGNLEIWWKRLWHMEIPHKVKVFLWKACRHWLPIRVCLAERHIPVEVVCLVCMREPEIVIHALWGCNGLMKRIWYLRNQLAHRERDQGMDMVLSWSMNFLLEFQKANVACNGMCDTGGTDTIKWSPPIADMYKINTDATLDVEANIVGVGIVIWNPCGDVMGSAAQRLVVSFLPPLAEAVAILRGIEFVIELGTLLVVESDARGMVNLINSGRPNLVEIGLVCNDIASRIQEGLVTWVQFVPRKENNVNHYLAKMALSIDYDLFLVESVPDYVERCILEDYPD